MPVKEIMAIAFMIVGVWYAEGGQKYVQRKIRLVQIQVLHNLGRTSNWGNPSIFKNLSPKTDKIKNRVCLKAMIGSHANE
jgi:hypothetical protein